MARASWTCSPFGCLNRYRTEQTGGQERIVFVPMFPCEESLTARFGAGLVLQQPVRPRADASAGPRAFGNAIVRKLFVADETVGPEVGDADLQFILAVAQHAGHVAAERRLPKRAERFAVQPDFGDDFDAAEVEEDFGFWILDWNFVR